jgi:SulP family sulfate permease
MGMMWGYWQVMMSKPLDQLKIYFRKSYGLVREILSYSQLHPIPIFRSLRGYAKIDLAYDLRAGFNVALLAFPQGMAYAVVAGLPIEYGIYGGILASIIGPIFSGSRFIMLGPTNATAVLLPVALGTVAIAEGGTPAENVPVIVGLAGLFLILGGIFRVANLTQYVSQAVVTGYITAAAIYIIVKQLSKVFFTEFNAPTNASLFEVLMQITHALPSAHWPSLVIGISTAFLFVIIKRFFPKWPTVATALILMSLLTAAIGWLDVPTFDAVNATQWRPMLPNLSYEAVSNLAGPALVIAFLSLLEGSSIGKTLAAKSGKKLDANQEMYSMGMANLACAFGNGMPASGSLTRSKLNDDSGARSPLSRIFSGTFCLIAVLALGSLIAYIPVASLATVVIFIGFSLINPHVIRLITKSTRSDAAVFVCTFLAALFIRLDFAIILGAAVSIILFLRKVSSPELVEYSFNEQGELYEIDDIDTRPTPHVSIVHVEGELFFGASELFRDQMRRVCEDPNLKIIVLRLKNAYRLDATSVMALEELIRHLRENDRDLIVSGARMDVYRVFKNSGLIEVLGADNFFMGKPSNPNVSTRNALKRAQELIGEDHIDVKIYYDPQHQKSESS